MSDAAGGKTGTLIKYLTSGEGSEFEEACLVGPQDRNRSTPRKSSRKDAGGGHFA
jgi:hypothetical protein